MAAGVEEQIIMIRINVPWFFAFRDQINGLGPLSSVRPSKRSPVEHVLRRLEQSSYLGGQLTEISFRIHQTPQDAPSV